MWIDNAPGLMVIGSDELKSRSRTNDSQWLFNGLTARPFLVLTEGADSLLTARLSTHDMVSFCARLYPKLRHRISLVDSMRPVPFLIDPVHCNGGKS